MNFENPKETDNEIKRAYQKLLGALAQVADLKQGTPQKTSLAWLLEDIKTKEPAEWQRTVDDLCENIATLNSAGGKVEVSHYLNELIGREYLDFLRDRLTRAQDEKIRHNLEIMIKMVESDLRFAQETKAKGLATSFGGVSRDFIPDWYQ